MKDLRYPDFISGSIGAKQDSDASASEAGEMTNTIKRTILQKSDAIRVIVC